VKVLHLSHSDISGGAARAAFRIHSSLREIGVDSYMWVNKGITGDWTVDSPAKSFARALASIRGYTSTPLVKALKTKNPILHSPAILPSQWVKRINNSDADLVHLHWVQGEMLSIADIGRVEKPIVWTLHDMWAFCGAEHVTWDERWRDGYRRDNRPPHESGFDLNRWSWQRKLKHWRRPMQIVAPSNWLGKCVRESALMRDWPVTIIPNCLDTDRWKPIDQALARELLGLPSDVPLILCGSHGANSAHHKGFDLLIAALGHLRDEVPGMEMVVVGELAPQSPPDLGFPIHYTGHLHDDLTLRACYSAADTVVVPSRQENLPNMAIEAQACGVPVVGFSIGGIPDIVEHGITGYLASPLHVPDLAKGIRYVLRELNDISTRNTIRSKVIQKYSKDIVMPKYEHLYEEVCSRK
tara:strand:+ start:658 stop:1893 length:1236 start_codon:yes stop_codon:yes gene_type:complete